MCQSWVYKLSKMSKVGVLGVKLSIPLRWTYKIGDIAQLLGSFKNVYNFVVYCLCYYCSKQSRNFFVTCSLHSKDRWTVRRAGKSVRMNYAWRHAWLYKNNTSLVLCSKVTNLFSWQILQNLWASFSMNRLNPISASCSEIQRGIQIDNISTNRLYSYQHIIYP